MEHQETMPDTKQVVYTNKARCRDCYRCLRACPVKAIKVINGQASVIVERCLSCGTCIRECPQGAKSFRNDVGQAIALLQGDGPTAGNPVAASVAPSFAALYGEETRRRLPGALRKLGFSYVGETALGASLVAHATANLVNRRPDAPHITTACPAAVSYIERRAPDLVRYLTPIVSPMAAHALHIKRTRGAHWKVVFFGPCVAKKAEAARENLADAVDVALTFEELDAWLEHRGIDLAACPEEPFDEEPEEAARFFPLPGGLARTAAFDTDLLARNCITVTGPSEMDAVLESLRARPQAALIEPLFCAQGCINGAGVASNRTLFDRRTSVIDYASTEPGRNEPLTPKMEELTVQYGGQSDEKPVSQEAVDEVLARTGKKDPADQLNCGACGYASCREQAEAVVRGMAQVEMCIPYMRRLAEQRSDKIIETTPNGIVVLDEQLRILHMNPSFRDMFLGTDALLGKPVSYLMDPEPFERLRNEASGRLELTVRHDQYSRICRQILYALPDDRQFVAIFVDITRLRASEDELGRVRSETLQMAEELLQQQFEAAREIATFLGQSTARNEQIIRNIKSLTNEEKPTSVNQWVWDTSSKKDDPETKR